MELALLLRFRKLALKFVSKVLSCLTRFLPFGCSVLQESRFLIPPEAASWSLDPAGTWEQTAEYQELRKSGKLFEVVQEHADSFLFRVSKP